MRVVPRHRRSGRSGGLKTRARPEIILETARAQTVVKDDEILVLAPTGSYSSLRFEDGLQLVLVEYRLNIVFPNDGPPTPVNAVGL